MLKVLGRGGGEGRVPSLIAAAVGIEVYKSHFFFFHLLCLVHGAFGINGNVMNLAVTPKEYHLGLCDCKFIWPFRHA